MKVADELDAVAVPAAEAEADGADVVSSAELLAPEVEDAALAGVERFFHSPRRIPRPPRRGGNQQYAEKQWMAAGHAR